MQVVTAAVKTPVLSVTVDPLRLKFAGATPAAQKVRLPCINAAKLLACTETMERLLAICVLDKASAWVFAKPKMPIETSKMETSTSISVKPCWRN